MDDIVKAPDVSLTEIEKKAYEEWSKDNPAPLSLSAALKLYELFLNYYSLDEICRINANKIPLGKIVDARIRFEWDKRRDEQIASVYSNIEKRVLRAKNDAILHVTDLLSAAHKIWGDKLKKFLQDGDASVLEDLNLSNVKQYKELIDLLKTLTERKEVPSAKAVQIEGIVSHIHSVKDHKKISSSDADNLLKLLDSKDVIDAS